MKGNADIVPEIIKCCQKREDILAKDGSTRKYNRYFDKMRKLAHELIAENRQDELLPYLESASIPIQRDVAGLLYNCYPDKCRKVLQNISNMSVKTGLPMCFIDVSVSASMALEIGIPKDFP